MKNNAFTKGVAGFGQGLAQVGLMTYRENLAEKLATKRAELLGKRDEVLNGYNQSLQSDRLASAEKIAEGNQSVTRAGYMSRATSAEADRKQRRTISDNEIEARKTISDNDIKARKEVANIGAKKPIRVGDGDTVYVDGQFEAANEGEADASRAPTKRERFRLEQKKALRTMLNGRHGGLLEKLNNTEKKEFDRLFIEASKMIDTGANHSVAFEKALGEFVREKEEAAARGNSATNPSALEAGKRFGFEIN